MQFTLTISDETYEILTDIAQVLGLTPGQVVAMMAADCQQALGVDPDYRDRCVQYARELLTGHYSFVLAGSEHARGGEQTRLTLAGSMRRTPSGWQTEQPLSAAGS